MNASVVAHERFMNGSRTILPRVGGGVGVRGGLGFGERHRPSISNWRQHDAPRWMAAPRQIGGK